jgi:hypothetical protein
VQGFDDKVHFVWTLLESGLEKWPWVVRISQAQKFRLLVERWS